MKIQAILPEGYGLKRRTREEGGGTVLVGGAKRVHIKESERRSGWHAGGRIREVASWQGVLAPEVVERLAVHDHQSRHGWPEDERPMHFREFAKMTATHGEARLGMPRAATGDYGDEELPERVEEIKAKRSKMRALWGDR